MLVVPIFEGDLLAGLPKKYVKHEKLVKRINGYLANVNYAGIECECLIVQDLCDININALDLRQLKLGDEIYPNFVIIHDEEGKVFLRRRDGAYFVFLDGDSIITMYLSAIYYKMLSGQPITIGDFLELIKEKEYSKEVKTFSVELLAMFFAFDLVIIYRGDKIICPMKSIS